MSWTHIQGHDALIEGFARVVERHRLAHAYLFVGAPGVGKKLFAKELAKTLLCERRGDRFEACDHCEACVIFQAGTHPDFFSFGKVEEKNEFTNDVMKEVCESCSLKPARGHGRIAVIDDVDYFNDESANMFLKTLEEPPPGSRFFLIGTSLDQQMATIKSRCQVVRFHPLPATIMKEILTREQVPVHLQPRLIHLASGSPGLALDLGDETLWSLRQTLIEGMLRPQVDFLQLVKKWTEYNENAGKETAKHRVRARLVLRLLIDFFAEGLTLSNGGSPRTADSGDLHLLNGLISRVDPTQILGFLERLLEAEEQLDRYIQIALVLEGLLDHWGQRWEERAFARV